MVSQIQALLEAIYDVRCEARAEGFVVDTEVAVSLGASGRADEELLVCEQEDGGLDMALYLSPALLQRLQPYTQGRLEGLLEHELDGFCQVTEGVSHFLYVVHTAAHGRTVSLLELEAQAEVDKFAVCLLQRWGEGVGTWARELLYRLFHQVSYRERLSPQERWRYEEANRLSHNFCQRLMRHTHHRRLERLLAELRYAYRLGAEAKLRHFAQAT